MKRLFLLTSLLFASTTFAAGIEQTVKVCTQVSNNVLPYAFSVGFRSTDLFASVKATGNVSNGLDCVDTTYSNGPKSIILSVYADSDALRGSTNRLKFNLDKSCSYLHENTSRFSGGLYISDELHTGAKNEMFTINISQSALNSDPYYYVFNVSCSQTSAN